MARQKEAGKVDQVEVALKRYADAVKALQDARLMERNARTSGDPESIDDAVYNRLRCEKEGRDASRAEGIARAARAAARAAAAKAR